MIDVVGRYVQLLSHEINNPLTVLFGQASLLRAQLDSPGTDPAKVSASLAILEQNTARVIGLVGELRDALRDVEVDPATLMCLADLLTSAEPFVRRAFGVRNVAFECPPVPREVLVCVGPVRTRAVIWKLWARALERGRGAPIRTSWSQGESVRLAILSDGDPVDITAGDLQPLIATLAKYEAKLRVVEGGVEIQFPRVD